MQASHFKNELMPNAITPGLCCKSNRPFKVKQMVKQKTVPYIDKFFCMHLGPTTSELYCSMTRIYNIASFELDASPKDYKPTNFLNHKHSLRFLLSQSYELNKKNIAKKEIVARELHGTLGVSHSTLNFISNFSFFAENERVILVNTFSCLGDSSLVHTPGRI